jgi:hypothetical protein
LKYQASAAPSASRTTSTRAVKLPERVRCLAAGPNHAFVSIGGAAAIDLQPGTDESYGAAINNAGQVAGYHTPAIGPTSAAVWTRRVAVGGQPLIWGRQRSAVNPA